MVVPKILLIDNKSIFFSIRKYKNKTFKDKKFNEIDNMVLSMIAYNSFENIFDEVEDNTLYSLGKRYVEKYTLKIITLKGLMYIDPYKILKEAYKTKRYKDIYALISPGFYNYDFNI